MTHTSSVRTPWHALRCPHTSALGFTNLSTYIYIYVRDSRPWHTDGNEVAVRRGGRKPTFFIIIIIFFFNSQVFELIEILQWKLFLSFLHTHTHTVIPGKT
jgi:hypothetical protein